MRVKIKSEAAGHPPGKIVEIDEITGLSWLNAGYAEPIPLHREGSGPLRSATGRSTPQLPPAWGRERAECAVSPAARKPKLGYAQKREVGNDER